jgi:hypothetical protein
MVSRRKTGKQQRRQQKHRRQTRKQSRRYRQKRRNQRGGSGIFSSIADFFNGTTPINHPPPNPQSLVENAVSRSPVLNPSNVNTDYGKVSIGGIITPK